jgi:hypothetical protein
MYETWATAQQADTCIWASCPPPKIWLMGIFPKKENYHQTIDHINRTLNIFELHQYLISLLRKTQNTFLEPALTIFG